LFGRKNCFSSHQWSQRINELPALRSLDSFSVLLCSLHSSRTCAVRPKAVAARPGILRATTGQPPSCQRFQPRVQSQPSHPPRNAVRCMRSRLSQSIVAFKEIVIFLQVFPVFRFLRLAPSPYLSASRVSTPASLLASITAAEIRPQIQTSPTLPASIFCAS
jgi:hypothetical protein